MAAGSPSPPANRFGDLRIRVLSGLAVAALGLGLLYLGGVWAMLAIVAVAGAMAWEYRSITVHDGGTCGFDAAFLIGGVAGGVVVAEYYATPIGFVWLAWSLLAGAVADFAAGRRLAAVWVALGGAYIGAAAIAFHYLRSLEPDGFATVLWLVLVVAGADIGGYFAGRLVGGPRLWERISPKKTWAGLGGGIAVAVLAGAVFALALPAGKLLPVCAASAVAALVALGGDLAESGLKRRFGVKDSGRVMPGHGGALDRFDALMTVALVAGLVTWWRGQAVIIW